MTRKNFLQNKNIIVFILIAIVISIVLLIHSLSPSTWAMVTQS
ncbi:cell shape-determining protein MreC [Metabacillus malikii]|uniref:Cell shape-determining protein MreC n=1 Tax=Metabacillus malikii TaxID=1504265 RepID=A0ABT9ZLC6_9BACI|nr:cell shape-determining protein MreC [Metabacillus malikii]